MRRHRMWRVMCACGLAVAMLVGTSCATVSDRGARASARALDALTPTGDAPASPGRAKPPCDPAHDGANLTKSLRPLDQLPPPGTEMSSSLEAIKQRGHLRVGVNDETLLLSFRNPETGRLEGFEWDLVAEIAQAIFGPGDVNEVVQANTVNTEKKVEIVVQGDADMTISAVSMTCARWNDVLLTTPYFVAHQKVLVRTDAQGHAVFPDGSLVPPATTIDALNNALAGRKVCWTTGSTSIDNIKKKLLSADPYTVDQRTDCLKALQEGTVDAVSSHDTFLLGYHLQDPNTTIIGPPDGISTQTYAIAVSQKTPDLVQFLNRLLLDLTSSGRLAEMYTDSFYDCAKCAGLEEFRDQLPRLPEGDPQWLD